MTHSRDLCSSLAKNCLGMELLTSNSFLFGMFRNTSFRYLKSFSGTPTSCQITLKASTQMPIHLGSFSHLKMSLKGEDVAEGHFSPFRVAGMCCCHLSLQRSEQKLFLMFLFLPFKTSYFCFRRQFIIGIFVPSGLLHNKPSQHVKLINDWIDRWMKIVRTDFKTEVRMSSGSHFCLDTACHWLEGTWFRFCFFFVFIYSH